MLTQCPECSKEISDKAISCPNCGYPMQPIKIRRQVKKKRPRLPNGFGQISEIKNKNLRKPFRAMVSIGTKENGRPMCKLLQPEAYFATYNEAYEALVKYHTNPYDLDKNITLEELYDRWFSVWSEKRTDVSTLSQLRKNTE